MKKICSLLLLSSFLLLSNSIKAQISGDNTFMPGRYVQVAIAANGSFGSTVSLPSGYYHSSPTVGVYDHATGSYTSTSNRLAFIYDAGHDGWTTGSPAFFGDYTLPGTPYEGWNLEINGAQANAWYQNYQSSASGYTGGLSMSGSNTTYSTTGGVITSVWVGSAGSGGALSIVQTTTIDTNASWIKVNTRLRNTTGSPLNNIYYMRAFDPDNDQTHSGSFNTRNTINYQNDYYHRVMVTAAGTSYTTQTVGLATKDCRAKCFSGTWPTSGYYCHTYYSGASGTIYSGTQTGDVAIGLVFNLGTLAAGDSTSLSYAFIFNGSTGIDSAYVEPQLIVNGTAVDTIDTVTACTFSGDTLFLNIINGNTHNWDRAHWSWAPNTSLIADTGIHSGVLMSGITSPITYTITGTDSALGTCERKVFLLTVYPTSTTAPLGSDVNYCIGATASPLTATGTSLLWYSSATGGTGSTTAPTPSTATAGTTSYYVSQTIAGCESPRDTINVIVSPGAAAIGGPTNVCVGSTITVTDATSSGTWSSSATSVATVVASTGVVTGVTSGTTTITYMLPSGCYVTQTITVNGAPSAITGPTVVCAGSTITLNSTPSGGTWTSSATSIATVGASSGVVTGVSAGTVTITYTATTGCIVTTSITVNPLPSAVTGPTSVCQYSTITLSSGPSGGSWSTGTSSVATIGSSTGIVTGVTAGTVTLTYMLTTGCLVTRTITVNPVPAAITGTMYLCASGGTTTLSDATSGGTWSSSNTALATVNSAGVVTGITAGTLYITYTNSTTGCYVTTPITVNALPTTISGPSAFCVNGTGTFSDGTSGGTWSSSNTSIATIHPSTGVATGLSAGTTTITYSLGTGCIVTANVTINPLPAAITGTMAVCEAGSMTNLYDATSGGNWSSGNTALATVDGSGMVTGVSAGTVNISYILTATGCGIAAAVTVNPLPANIAGPSAVCIGSTITLTDATTGGSWSSSSSSLATVTAGGIVTGVAYGTPDITYTLPTGCITTKNISVNSLPATITGTPVVCQSLTTTFSNSVSGGSWSSGTTSVATINSSGVITGVSAGTSDITYMLGTGCEVTRTVTVNPLPAAIAGASDVCNTYSTTYTDATGGGTWSSGSSSIATISTTGVITGNSPGSTTITYTLSTGCLQTQAITVNALPAAIAGATNVCVAATAALTDATGSGSWSTSAAGIATVGSTSGIVTGVSAGSVIVTYTVPGGCFITMGMTVNPLPAAIAGSSNVCEGSTTTLTDASGSGTWTSSNTALATVGSTSGVVSGVVAGTVNITFSLPTTCYITKTVVVNPTPLAITGTPEVCEAGSTTTLANTLAGGTWSSANTAIATASTTSTTTGSITGVSAGTVNITYMVGTCYNTASVTVHPLPGAVITPLGDTMMCPGGFVVLASSTGTGYTYQWYTASGAISGETDDYYIANSGANYRSQVTSNHGCVSFSSPMTVSINPATATIAAAGATTICTGSTAILNANTGAGLTYQWLLGGAGIAGATSSVYNAPTAGYYSVVVSNGVGCSATSSSIPVNTLPAPTNNIVSTGALTFCNGGSVILTADTGTGYSYQWQQGGIDISGATNINYTASTSGNYQVVVTNSYPCSSTSTIATITAIALPNANISVSGSSTFCTGGSVYMSAVAVSGNTYQWYKNGVVISGATGSYYMTTTGGDFTVRINAATGCTNITYPAFHITEVSIPIIVPHSATKFCWGGSALLGVSVSVSIGVTYQWQVGGADIAGATNSTYSAHATGNYSCIVNIPGGCTVIAAAVTVTQYPLPNPVIYYDGVSLSTGGYYVNYQWFHNYVPVAGIGNNITPNELGGYTVKVIDTNGCQSVSTAYIVRRLGSSRSLGITNLGEENIQIFPNPAQNIVHILANTTVHAIINAVDGRKVMDQQEAKDLDISQLADGVYMLMIYDNDGHILKTEKLIKQ